MLNKIRPARASQQASDECRNTAMKQRKTWWNTATAAIAVLAFCVAAEWLLTRRDRLTPYRVREKIVWSEAAGRGVLRGRCRMPLDESGEVLVFYAIPLGGDRKPGPGAEDVVFYLPRYGERGDTVYDDRPAWRKYVETDGGSFCSFRILRVPEHYPDRAALSRCVAKIRLWLSERYHLAAHGRCYLVGSGVGCEVIAALCREHHDWVRAACIIRRPEESAPGWRQWRGTATDFLVVRERPRGAPAWRVPEGSRVVLVETEEALLFAPLDELLYAFWRRARDRDLAAEEAFHHAEADFRRRPRPWREISPR